MSLTRFFFSQGCCDDSFVNSFFVERYFWHVAHVVNPNFLVGLGKVVDVFVGGWTRVQTAGCSFANERRSETSTLSLGHMHESVRRVNDVSCMRMVVSVVVINLVRSCLVWAAAHWRAAMQVVATAVYAYSMLVRFTTGVAPGHEFESFFGSQHAIIITLQNSP